MYALGMRSTSTSADPVSLKFDHVARNFSLNNTEIILRDLKSNDSVIAQGKLKVEISTEMEKGLILWLGEHAMSLG